MFKLNNIVSFVSVSNVVLFNCLIHSFSDIAGSEEDDRKAKTVSEIIECSDELARELLASCGGDVKKVVK